MTADTSDLPLEGVLVLDMCQFLSGPYCSLRLQDLGARVIKIERPGLGDLSRRLYLSDTEIGGDSTIFHAINRSKESLALDMKDPDDLAALKTLIGKADVVLQNFRPGVIQRIGLDYETLKQDFPGLVYGSITGYGDEGPWVSRPGQDLLAQARSGVMWLNGDDGQGPVPFGLAIADMLAGAALAQGAALAVTPLAIPLRPALADVYGANSELPTDLKGINKFLKTQGFPPLPNANGLSPLMKYVGTAAAANLDGLKTKERAFSETLLVRWNFPSGWLITSPDITENGEAGTLGANNFIKGDSEVRGASLVASTSHAFRTAHPRLGAGVRRREDGRWQAAQGAEQGVLRQAALIAGAPTDVHAYARYVRCALAR